MTSDWAVNGWRRGILTRVVVVASMMAACGGSDSASKDVGAEEDTTGPILPDVVEFEVDVNNPPEDVFEPPKPGELGYECDDNLDCNSGFCIQTAEGRQCTRTCIDSCPAGWDCRQSPGQDAVFVCLPRFINLCDPCREAADCNGPGQSGNYCLKNGDDGSFCGAACNADGDCPEGFSCDDVMVAGVGEIKQCVPADEAECTCSPFAKQRQATTNCAITNENGSCEGKRLCLQQGLSLCDAETPFPESCNGLDDNCNDRVDEFPPDYACNIENDIGTCIGRGTCVEGVETCVGREPKLDNNCDGIDDDCDGSTDEESCNDGNACTRDVCTPNADGSIACTHVNETDTVCNDGNACTTVDRCLGGTCVGSSPKSCDDGNPCTIDACDPVTGECVSTNAAANTVCNSNPCMVGEFCDGQGGCVGGTPKAFVPKSQGGCIEESGGFHADCQSFECVGAGVCVPKHHERRDFDCRVGTGTCSTGKCGTDGRCGSTVAPNTACTNPTNAGGQCKTPVCVGFECRNADVAATAQIPCRVSSTCPPCARTLGFCICTGDGPGVCGSGGACVEAWSPNVNYCSSDACIGCQGLCPNICGFYVCFQ